MLRILGVELTQAIQYFDSPYPVCGSPPNLQPCADNALPLVAGRPTAVRVYFDGAAQGVPVTGFGVRLHPDGSPSTVTFPATKDLVNVPSPPAREDSNQTLNIIVPAQASSGRWKLSVSIFERPATGVGQVAAWLVEVSFIERALVPIRVVRMHYKGRGLDIAPPTMTEFWQMADFAQRTWPSPLPVFCVVRESVEVFDGAFTTQIDSDDPAEIGTTGTIWDILERLKASEGLAADTVYFGFYPNGAGANGGVGNGYMFIAPNVIPQLMAHELGHAQGLPHAPTPAFGPLGAGADQTFPHYGMVLPWGSIGEVGFDPRTGTAFPPATFFDFMGYNEPKWVSPHHYQKLFAAVGIPKPGPCSKSPPPFTITLPPRNRVFYCYFVEGLPGGDFIKKICGPGIELPVRWPPEGSPGPIRVTVLDALSVTIFENTFQLWTVSEPHDAPRQRGFWIAVPDLDGARRLLVTYGDKVIEDSELAMEPVAFEAKAWLLDTPTPAVRVEWALSPEDVRVPVFVRASSDGGSSWTAFNVPSGTKQIDIDPASLPPGNSCVVEVLAGERLRATSWKSAHITVPTGRDALLVLAPHADTQVNYGDAIELAATTTYGQGFEEIIWNSDRDGDLGMGGYQLARLSPGRHVLSIRRGMCGKRVRGGVVRVVRPSGHEG